MKVKLGDLIKPAKVIKCNNGSYPVLSMTMHSGIILQNDRFKKNLASVDQSNYKVVYKGQLVIGFPIDEGVLYIQNVVKKGIMSPAYNIWDINYNIINDKYLELCLHSPQAMQYYRANLRGTTARRRSIPTETLLKLPINLPPLDEQRHIAAVLDKVSDLIALRKKQLAKLDELVKARFVEMFGGICNSTEYPYVNIEDFTSVVSGGTPNREISEYWDIGSIRWVKTTELQNCIITDTEEKISQVGLDNSSAKLIPVNSVLIAMYGQGKTRGMTGYLAVECSTNQACACILPSKKINSKFLWQYMMLSYDKLRDMAKGGNQPNLNIGIIKKFPVIMPPQSQQDQFVLFMEKIDKTRFIIQVSLEKLETLKKSLMQEYFG